MAKRRGNGEGSIYFDEKRNRYEGQYFYEDPITGERKRKKLTGKSKAAIAKRAKEFLAQVEKEREAYLAEQSKGETVKEWLDTWLECYIRSGVRVKTYERYRCSIDNHIVPYIGSVAIGQLTAEDVQQMLNDLLDEGGENHQGLAPRTVNAARRTLKTALEKAYHLKKISYNPVGGTKACRAEKAHITILTHEQAQTLLHITKQQNQPAYMAILLAISTGMRLGEIMGLRWDSIDFPGKKLYVTQSLVSTSRGPLLEPAPKTNAGYRQIELPKHCMEALQEHQTWQEHQKAEWLDQYLDEGLVVANDNGRYIDPSYFSYAIFKKLLKQAGIPGNVRFHDLRHTHATWLLEKGVHPKVVAERLGHSSIRITLDTYSHVVKGLQQMAVIKLDEIADNW